MTTPLDRRLRTLFAEQERAGLTRSPPQISERHGVRYRIHGHPVIGFCSNDYLGLADHPDLCAPPPISAGATASRLVCGDLPEHRSLESRLADLAGAEDAVLFPSGFQLNVGALPALIRSTDPVFSDALNHASLIDGLRLSRANLHVLEHGTAPPDDLPPDESRARDGALGPTHANREPEPNSPARDGLRWWVTEALFSMDGDYADPAALRTHLDRGGCLYLDEAHSFGLFTRDGRLTGHAGHHRIQPTALVGTLGKTFGCAGAFIAASALACRWIRGCARSFVFSTGTSPLLATQISRAIDLVAGPEGDHRRALLWANVERLARHLDCPDHRSPIFRVILGSNEQALTLSAALLERGWHAQAIRPPTVPRGTSRLRITVTAAHEPSQIDAFAADLRKLIATIR